MIMMVITNQQVNVVQKYSHNMFNEKVKHILKSISDVKNDVVFVGTLAYNFHKVTDKKIKDIDIVVNNLDGLNNLSQIRRTWDTDSPYSISGKRAGMRLSGYTIDIFIQEKLPEYITDDNLKYVNVSDIKKYCNFVLTHPKINEYPHRVRLKIEDIQQKMSLYY